MSQACLNCGVTKTPIWRKGLDNRVVCNACGLYFRNHGKSRPMDVIAGKRSRSAITSGGMSRAERRRIAREAKEAAALAAAAADTGGYAITAVSSFVKSAALARETPAARARLEAAVIPRMPELEAYAPAKSNVDWRSTAPPIPRSAPPGNIAARPRPLPFIRTNTIPAVRKRERMNAIMEEVYRATKRPKRSSRKTAVTEPASPATAASPPPLDVDAVPLVVDPATDSGSPDDPESSDDDLAAWDAVHTVDRPSDGLSLRIGDAVAIRADPASSLEYHAVIAGFTWNLDAIYVVWLRRRAAAAVSAAPGPPLSAFYDLAELDPAPQPFDAVVSCLGFSAHLPFDLIRAARAAALITADADADADADAAAVSPALQADDSLARLALVSSLAVAQA
ncbi:uncharacterized protein AMSG_08016 [Thecamonas trahens ATCC 50062]|uniref:GATA-type domain-containing protein n=1 Tax=Thecamonas trahens ATCC 50062 TaxID=461836 RepID=A0A0L0DJ78_THETB|nr:hypothetical protein AMSG_08016 [Thecamonas trahens ATCC 50062]KNC52459.1 hypothetical protein AMSG_08016 [Thecamonas trahens ATCC 50062]|eukprot:XP_013755262.1 hypothetical protein AMSG_08016 [Thecamonas trahens ATCC 50062]